MAAKKGLGKGLDSLIVNKNEGVVLAEEADKSSTVEIDINKIEPNKNQPRKHFDEDALEELASNIKIHGIINPLIVQDRNGFYEIIGGERRWRAARMAGLKKVPVVVKHLSEQEFVEISLIDNLQRQNLNAIEEALAYKRLSEEFNLKQDEVAERVSKSRTAITNSLRLLKLDERVQQMIVDEMLTMGQARAILSIEDGDKQFNFAQRIFDEKLSVREVEKEVKKINSGKVDDKPSKEPKINSQLQALYGDLEESMKNKLGTKVVINPKDSKTGKIEIEYYSQDELDRIINLLQSVK